MEHDLSREILFQENEYDLLEKRLMQVDSFQAVFRIMANFLAKKFECRYVLFHSDINSADGRVLNYGERVPNSMNMHAEISERRKSSIGKDALLRHSSGCFSVPFKLGDDELGYIFVGPRMDGERHSMNNLRDMIPVVRTLNHVLLYISAVKEREKLNQMKFAFSKYVSAEVVDSIIKNPDEVELGGKKAVLSVIFTDLQEFTSLSELLPPEKLVRILNMYFSEMSEVIFGLCGTIDKFEGDAIMAFFGAPRVLEDHAVRCCLSALRLRRMEVILNEQLIREKLIDTPLYTRIGINTGEMVVGNVGSATRFEYTIIGSNVNIASRIEDCNKVYGTQILISEQTYNSVKDLFECRFVADANLKGVSHHVKLYELIGEKPELVAQVSKFDRNAVAMIAAANADDVDEVEELEEVEELDDIEEL